MEKRTYDFGWAVGCGCKISTTKTIGEVIGATIKRHRERMGWSKAFLANALGIEYSRYITRWEKGENTPSLDTLLDLARLFGISLNELVLGQDSSEDGSEAGSFLFNRISYSVCNTPVFADGFFRFSPQPALDAACYATPSLYPVGGPSNDPRSFFTLCHNAFSSHLCRRYSR